MTDLSHLKDPQPSAEQLAAEVDAMTLTNVIALCTAIVAWLTYNVSPSVGKEIATMAQRIEESWGTPDATE
jgi:hypothetical protein